MLLRIVVLCILLAGVCACSVNPATGEADFVTMTEGMEVSLGRSEHEKIMQQVGVYDGEALNEYVTKVGEKVAATSDRPNLDYLFTIIDSPDINAFALPGGYIYINRGLMSYLDSEAELAAVLAHEIGHVTARHTVRQQSANQANSVGSTVVGLLTRSRSAAEATGLYGAYMIADYGRDMELEADSFGAQYLFNSGFNPEAMVEVIGVLKDQEVYAKSKAKRNGKSTGATYHGVFSTHPRNDKRLKQVIAKAGTLPEGKNQSVNVNNYRKQINGMTYGKFTSKDKQRLKRYFNSKLKFTIRYPDDWQVTSQGASLLSKPDAGEGELLIALKRQLDDSSAQVILENYFGVDKLSDGAELDQAGLKGYTALHTDNASVKRVAVIFHRKKSFIFTGWAPELNQQQLADYEQQKAALEEGDDELEPLLGGDELIMASIESFRGLNKNETVPGPKLVLRYIEVEPGMTFARLAAKSKIPNDAEAQLRLLNGFYPRGEPHPGDLIKIVE